MSLKEITLLTDQIVEMDTKAVGLTGGNPLIREDIGEIIDYIKSKGIKIYLTSGGSLIPEKLNVVKKIDFLQLSFDGPREVNDLQRYKGAYRHFIHAVELAKAEKIKFYTLTVLTKNNINSIEFILDFTKKNKIFAYFQPVDKTFFLENNSPELNLEEHEYKMVVYELIKLKRNNRYLGNSLASLKFMYEGNKKYRCFGGRYLAYVHSNGDVYPCWTPPDIKVLNWKAEGFKSVFLNMPTFSCNRCRCISNIELNLMYAFNVSKIYEEISRRIVSVFDRG